MREILTNIILIGITVAFLTHFAMIGIYKQVLIQEPNLTIFAAEVCMLVTFAAFGISNLIHYVRR